MPEVERTPPGRARLSYATVSTTGAAAKLLFAEFVHAPLADELLEAAKEVMEIGLGVYDPTNRTTNRMRAAIRAYEKGTPHAE